MELKEIPQRLPDGSKAMSVIVWPPIPKLPMTVLAPVAKSTFPSLLELSSIHRIGAARAQVPMPRRTTPSKDCQERDISVLPSVLLGERTTKQYSCETNDSNIINDSCHPLTDACKNFRHFKDFGEPRNRTALLTGQTSIFLCEYRRLSSFRAY